MSAEVPAPERIKILIWLAYLGGVNVGCHGVKVVKRGVRIDSLAKRIE